MASTVEIQEALQRAGFTYVVVGGSVKKLEADGVYGPITRTAVTLFQKSKGLPQTGSPDTATITALGLATAVVPTQPQPGVPSPLGPGTPLVPTSQILGLDTTTWLWIGGGLIGLLLITQFLGGRKR